VHCKALEHEGRNDLIVYISKNERDSKETNEFLSSMKKQYENIIIFTSGEEKLEGVIYKLIRDKQTDNTSSANFNR
jgi:hypothetical protein